MALTQQQVDQFMQLDDFHVAPYYEDGKTTGKLTWIWFVVFDDNLYIRAWNGENSRWFKSARQQKAGIVQIDGKKYQAEFEYITMDQNQKLIHKIDESYRLKYADSRYLLPMIARGPQNATFRVKLIG